MQGDIPSWAEALERAAREVALLDAALADETAWRRAGTAIALGEAVAAVAARGMMADGLSILALQAQARTPGGRGTWTGAALFRAARLVLASDPDEVLSEHGIRDLVRRVRTVEAAPAAGRRDRSARPDTSSTPLSRDLRLWLEEHAAPRPPAVGPGSLLGIAAACRALVVAARTDPQALHLLRMILPALLAQRGLTRRPALFPGRALRADRLNRLAELGRTDAPPGAEAAFLELFLPMLAEAARRTRSTILSLQGLHRRLSAKIETERSGSALPYALEAVFERPLLSAADLRQAVGELNGRRPALRTAQLMIGKLEAIGAVRRVGARTTSRMWSAADPTLLGA